MFLSNLLWIVFIIVYLVFFIACIGFLMQRIRGIAPSVPSTTKLHNAIIAQIKSDFPNAKTIIDVGSGWGGLVRHIARSFQKAKVFGIEISGTPYIYSKIMGIFHKNSKIIFGDAFKFLNKDNQKFDIGITYLLPKEMQDIEKLKNKFKMLFVLDFPLPNTTPIKKIKLYYGKMLRQHYLYVYKF